MGSVIRRAYCGAYALFVLGLASCAHVHQHPTAGEALPPVAEADNQAAPRDVETKPASPLTDRNSSPIWLVSHDEVASALDLEPVSGSLGAPDSTGGELFQTAWQPPAAGVPGAPAQPPAGPIPPGAGTSGVPAPSPGPGAAPVPGVTTGPGGAVAVGPQPPGLPAGTPGQPETRITSLAGVAGAAEAELALNTIGDQGTISFGPQPGNKAAISIMRNFALNITDNNSARLQNRLIPVEYYHFFAANRAYPGLPFEPGQYAALIHPSRLSSTRVITNDDRYIFGFETILAQRLSLVVRQSVVTINQPDVTLQQGYLLHRLGGIHTGWGDLQLSPKYLIFEDKKQLLSGGVGMIIPLGENSPYRQFGNSAFVFQPYLLYLLQPTERWVIQGGVEYDIPVATNLDNVSLFRWMTFLGYRLYHEPQSKTIQTIYPLIEFHGEHLVGGFTQNTVNFTTGFRVNCFRRFQFGVGYAVPVTDQKQFSNEILASLNYFF